MEYNLTVRQHRRAALCAVLLGMIPLPAVRYFSDGFAGCVAMCESGKKIVDENGNTRDYYYCTYELGFSCTEFGGDDASKLEAFYRGLKPDVNLWPPCIRCSGDYVTGSNPATPIATIR